jgi:CRP-like cAMP-binding protein
MRQLQRNTKTNYSDSGWNRPAPPFELQETSVPTPASEVVVNRLIDNLPRAQRERFLAQCTPEQLIFGEVLCSPGTPAEHVHFPLTGFISLVTSMDGHGPLEVGMIGNEGMLGATLALGIEAAPMRGVVQGSGTALKMTAAQFHRQLGRSPDLRRTLNGYLCVQLEQLAQTATCNSFHEVMERLARWLLMTHDRAHSDSLHLTHLFLADMLGVRRSAVTIAAGELQRRRFIRYSRGRIQVLSRQGLQSAACACYSASVKTYDRHLPVITPRSGAP